MKLEAYCKETWMPYFIKGKKYKFDFMASTFYEKLITDEQGRDIIISRLEFENTFTWGKNE